MLFFGGRDSISGANFVVEIQFRVLKFLVER